MLVKFKIILDINSEVLFTIYHNKIRAVTIFIFHLVVKIWVIFTNVKNFTLLSIYLSSYTQAIMYDHFLRWMFFRNFEKKKTT